MGRVGLELSAEPVDVGVDRVLVAFVTVAPDLVEKLASAVDPAWVAGEVVQEVELPGGQVHRRLDLELDIQLLASILAGLKNDRRRILLVGHEPSFSTVIGDLTGGVVVMRKGALARVDLTPGEMTRGRLVWLLQPRVLLNLD